MYTAEFQDILRLQQRISPTAGPDSVATPTEYGGMPPWKVAPDGYQPFDYATSIAMPAQGVDTAIVSFFVPQGMDGVIVRIANDFSGVGFQDGVGDLAWRIFRDQSAVQGYDAITVRLGNVYNPGTIDPGIRVRSGQLVKLMVNNVTNNLAGNCPGRLGGYFYPVKGN